MMIRWNCTLKITMTIQISLGCGWVMEEKCHEKLLLGDLGKIGCKTCSSIKLVEFILSMSLNHLNMIWHVNSYVSMISITLGWKWTYEFICEYDLNHFWVKRTYEFICEYDFNHVICFSLYFNQIIPWIAYPHFFAFYFGMQEILTRWRILLPSPLRCYCTTCWQSTSPHPFSTDQRPALRPPTT